MMERTRRTTVSFRQPFTLRAVDGEQPAGDYEVLIDEELVDGISRIAWRRVKTIMCLPSIMRARYPEQMIVVEPAELEAALTRDREQTEMAPLERIRRRQMEESRESASPPQRGESPLSENRRKAAAAAVRTKSAAEAALRDADRIVGSVHVVRPE